MRLDQREQGATRHQILNLLRRHGQMTAAELSDTLKIGAVGVRQHLAFLERDELVHVAGVRRGMGRPSHLYALTPAAEAMFPKRYDRIAMDVLAFVEASGGKEALDRLFEARRQLLAAQYGPRLEGKSRAEQVAELAAILNEQGYMCEWSQVDDTTFMLTEHNCPIDCVAREYHQACEQEIALYQDILGIPIERTQTMTAGDDCCCYRIKTS